MKFLVSDELDRPATTNPRRAMPAGL